MQQLYFLKLDYDFDATLFFIDDSCGIICKM
jgi:hypothetical protein